MKSKLLAIAIAASIVWTACNGTDTDTTTSDSLVSTTTDAPTDNTTTDAGTGNTTTDASTNRSTSFDESGSYVDLKTNKPIRLKHKEGSEDLVDYETNEPYTYFFYNPATKDTFDRSGNIVNHYLIKTGDGEYTLDGKRWKIKKDSDGDIKMKDGDETKIKYDASSGKTKIKTEDTTIKH